MNGEHRSAASMRNGQCDRSAAAPIHIGGGTHHLWIFMAEEVGQLMHPISLDLDCVGLAVLALLERGAGGELPRAQAAPVAWPWHGHGRGSVFAGRRAFLPNTLAAARMSIPNASSPRTLVRCFRLFRLDSSIVTFPLSPLARGLGPRGRIRSGGAEAGRRQSVAPRSALSAPSRACTRSTASCTTGRRPGAPCFRDPQREVASSFQLPRGAKTAVAQRIWRPLFFPRQLTATACASLSSEVRSPAPKGEIDTCIS